MTFLRSQIKKIVLSATLMSLAAVAAWGLLTITTAYMTPLSLDQTKNTSITVSGRDGRLLRAFTTKQGRWRLPVAVADVDPRYLKLLLAYEDKRFPWHDGVDYLAMVRAAYLLVRHGRFLSGGSTLTMQVSRLLDGRHERTLMGKLRQIVRAKQLEAQLTKKEILRLYLQLAPFGGNIEGVRAASLAYFGKEPRHLSVGQAALLVALPQSPERRRPDRHHVAARDARNFVIDRAVTAGVLELAEANRAKAERVPSKRVPFPKLAPHAAEEVVAAFPDQTHHQLTLDRNLQASLERLAKTHTLLLGQKLSAALLVVENKTGKVRAHVGSSDYLDQDRWGPIDMTRAVRSPGSTLKPFVYGIAFDKGIAHPETLIDDRRTRFGSYTPENFDDTFHGTVTIREALGQSLNIPAVKVLSALGPGLLVGTLRQAGFTPELPGRAIPSLAVALGGVGMTMRDMAALYAALARGGTPRPLVWRSTVPREKTTQNATDEPKPVLSSLAAWYVTDILKDAPPPPNAKRGRIAYKTGTSYGYRDAWAIGYDNQHTVAVWVGRPDAVSTPGLLGRLSAAPLLFDAFSRIPTERMPFGDPPPGVINSTTANLPPPLKRFRETGDEVAQRGPYLEPPVLIAFPPDRAEIEVADREEDSILLKAEGGALPLTWLVNGKPMTQDPHRRELNWQPKDQGFVNLSVIDANGRADRVTIRVH